jgi:hypothetical protein
MNSTTPMSNIPEPLTVFSDMLDSLSLTCNHSANDNNSIMSTTTPMNDASGPLAVLTSTVNSLSLSYNNPANDDCNVPLATLNDNNDQPVSHDDSHINDNDVPLSLLCNDSSGDHSSEHELIENALPVVMEGAHFGDSLRCATINSRGSGDHFAKVEIIADFAADKLLDIVCVTELKTTLARAKDAIIRHRGFFGWWGARDVVQSYNDGVLLLVCDEWAKYVQKVEYWSG